MHRRKYILALFFLLTLEGFSQNSMPEIDKKTYQLYQEQNWEELIKTGKKAQKNGINFYYLDYRMGIAYYTLKKYRQSIPYFKAAFEINNEDAKLAEYLYYAYLFSGNDNAAILFASKISEDKKKNLKESEIRFFDAVDVSFSGSKINNKAILEADYIESKLEPTDQGIQEISKEYSIINFGLGHRFSPNFSLKHAYSGLNKRDFYYTRDFDGVFVDDDRQTNQNQYYFGLNYYTGLGFNLKGGFHYVGIKYFKETITQGNRGRQVRKNETVTSDEMLYFGSIDCNAKNLNLSFSGSWANLSSNSQFQKNFTFTYYPFGNLNAYTVSTLSHHSEKTALTKVHHWIFYQKIGFGFKEKVWLEPYMLLGDVHNFASADASIIYNSIDVVKQSFGCNLIVPVYGAKFLLNLSFSNSAYESSFYEFIEGELENKTSYKHNSLNGGILWKL